jgi:pyruvate,water dikinase
MTQVKLFYWLDRIQLSHRPLVGETALALSQLRQQGYPSLPGFAISSVLFREFLDSLDDSSSLLADFPYSSLYVDIDDPQALQLVAQQSRQTITQATLPTQWLSDLMAAAQQLGAPTLTLQASLSLSPDKERFLKHRLLPSSVCWCESGALAEALKQVWAGLFSARSLFYWQRAGIGIEQVNFAVLVQPIHSAIASGTVQIYPDSLQVQATWGLGHSLVKGEVLPDCYEIERATGKLKNQRLGSKIRAYRLKSQVEGNGDNSACLEAYPLSQTEQENYALDETRLNILIQLAQTLLPEPSSSGSFEWTLTQTPKAQAPEFYVTQFILAPPPPPQWGSVGSQMPVESAAQGVLRGTPASPGVAIAIVQCLNDAQSESSAIPDGRILVTKKLRVEALSLLKTAAGIVIEQGGVTSHAAILARELQLPAIVGAISASDRLQTGDLIFMNGNTGELYPLSAQGETGEGLRLAQQPRETPPVSQPPYLLGTKLMVNLSQPNTIARAAALPVDGVGLLRSELMLLDLLAAKPLESWLQGSQQVKFVEQIAHLVTEFATAFAPRPIFYRSFNRQGTDPSSLQTTLRQGGTADYLSDPTLFDLELKALAQVMGAGHNIKLILPFVRSVEEFCFCRRRLEQAGLTQGDCFQLWIMAEVPSVLFLLPDYIRAGVQGIAIGTNDLMPLLLGIDREQVPLTPGRDRCHPALLAAIAQLIDLAQAAGIPCSICGHAPVQYPELIEQLIEWGITTISVEPEAVAKTSEAIARAEHRLLLKAARAEVKSLP